MNDTALELYQNMRELIEGDENKTYVENSELNELLDSSLLAGAINGLLNMVYIFSVFWYYYPIHQNNYILICYPFIISIE